ncbi:hypothetical protein ABPG74_005744 [Tetrahymena malaccensis]
MDFKDRQRLLGQKRDWWDMNNYVKTGFTQQSVKRNMFENGVEEIEKEEEKEEINREELIQLVYGKKESELSELERMGVDAFYKDKDRDDTELKEQAKRDYELKQKNYGGFVLKRFDQGIEKDGIEFVKQKILFLIIQQQIQ